MYRNVFLSAILLSLICILSTKIDAQGTQSNGIDSKLYSSVKWRHIGPFRGGRSCAVTGVPGKPNLFYFGATGGGVWKTTNGGTFFCFEIFFRSSFNSLNRVSSMAAPPDLEFNIISSASFNSAE